MWSARRPGAGPYTPCHQARRSSERSMIKQIGVILLLSVTVFAACRSPDTRSPEEVVGARPPASPEPTPASPEERARVHTELAASYLQIRRMGVALTEVQEALKADSDYVPAHNVSGLIYMQLGEDKKAEASFQRALRLDPKDSDANNSYGLFLCERKRGEEGIKHFMTALKNPLYATPQDSFVNAGVCSRRMGDDVAAQKYFEQALAVQRNDPRALINLAQLYFDHKQYYLAKERLDKFMQQNKNPDPGALWLGARVENKIGDEAALMSYGAQLKDKFPDSREAHLYSQGQFE
ncbi:MAG: type IV pilus biogenesis/stability protein PilW [Betaproteobacteria bacterium]|nr:type IV pilus biogenesis/stability protein PilW [Betaproteobacteria bacterium]